MIGQSPAFRLIQVLIDKIAAFVAPVLIEGETGTGKELAARAIHYRGARRSPLLRFLQELRFRPLGDHLDRVQSGARGADYALHRHRTPATGALIFLFVEHGAPGS